MHIYIGCDHGAFELKEDLKKSLTAKGCEVFDEGCMNLDPVDYPDIAKSVCSKVLANEGSKGIIMCGTGIGISISANRMKGIRAALCTNEYMARMSRIHNDANVLCMGGRVLGPELAKAIVDVFLSTEFSNEPRHKNRIQKIEEM